VTNVTRGYFDTICWCLKKGEYKGVFLQGLIPLIILANMKFDYLKYQSIRLQNRKNRDFIIKINNLYNMYLDLSDEGLSSDLALSKEREWFTTDYIQKIVTEDMNIIDIGANVGYYALLESQLTPKGHVYAIEPVPVNYNMLTKNITLNNCTNVSTFDFAIGNTNKSSDMYVYEKHNWSSLIQNPQGKVVEKIQVPVITLDKFVESYVTEKTEKPLLIRMDVEGSEYDILKGSSKIFQTIRPLIIGIEMHPHLMSKEKALECIKIMKENQFTIKTILRDPDRAEFKIIRQLNKLKNILDLPQFGYLRNDYNTLEELMVHRHGATVFFEKK